MKPEAVLYAFDLIELDGEDLRDKPIEKRKAALERLLAKRAKPAKGKKPPAKAIHPQLSS